MVICGRSDISAKRTEVARRHRWTAPELDTIRRYYAIEPTKILARRLPRIRSMPSIRGKARAMGVLATGHRGPRRRPKPPPSTPLPVDANHLRYVLAAQAYFIDRSIHGAMVAQTRFDPSFAQLVNR